MKTETVRSAWEIAEKLSELMADENRNKYATIPEELAQWIQSNYSIQRNKNAMKLNSFKFQDGKIFWLPEYPDKPEFGVWSSRQIKEQWVIAAEESLASVIEVAPEDVNDFKLLWERTYRGVPMSGEVYSVECEMEIRTKYICELDEMQCGETCHGNLSNKIKCTFCTVRQVARLKPSTE